MNDNLLKEEQFLKEIAEHQMEIIKDDGVHRYIRFSKPNTSCMHFDLATWPGYLCYSGDMGTYVFSRTRDMFEFFRTDRKKGKLGINLSYWSEKLQAVDGGRRGGSAEEFDEDKFRRVINEYRVQWMRDAKDSGSLDKEGRRELWESVDNEVLCSLEDGSDRALNAAYEFNHKPLSASHRRYGWSFTDLFEHNFNEYTHRFQWCCYALAWSITKYDQSKEILA